MIKVTKQDGTVEYHTTIHVVFMVTRFICNLVLAYCIVHFIYKYW